MTVSVVLTPPTGTVVLSLNSLVKAVTVVGAQVVPTEVESPAGGAVVAATLGFVDSEAGVDAATWGFGKAKTLDVSAPRASSVRLEEYMMYVEYLCL